MDTATTNPDTYRLVWLDPRQLAGHPLNVRHDLGDVTELADSIRASGIVEPLVVVPVGGSYRLVAGHRRNLASVQAGVSSWCRASSELTGQIVTRSRSSP